MRVVLRGMDDLVATLGRMNARVAVMSVSGTGGNRLGSTTPAVRPLSNPVSEWRAW